MKVLTAITLLAAAACVGEKPAPADTTQVEPTRGVSHVIARKAEPDSLFDNDGNFCVVKQKPHWETVSIGDAKADSFCQWQKPE